MKALFIAFPDNAVLTRSLVSVCNSALGSLRWHRFPDGESRITLDDDCDGRDVVFVCSLRDPDRHALPLLFAARTARELGARSVGLVAPYLAYLRQDSNFHPGEAISSQHFADYLSWTFDWLVTVDPHLHRHPDLGALFRIPARHTSAMPLVADWIRSNIPTPILIGPDSESAQWVQPVAEALGAPALVLTKRRHGDREVEISLPDGANLDGRTPVLVDDIVSSGHTLVETLEALGRAHTLAPVCIAVHGVFADQADARLRAAGARQVVTTNSIEHATNAIDLAPVLQPLIAQQLAVSAKAQLGPAEATRPRSL